MMKKEVLILSLLFVALAPAYPKIVLSNAFCDNMVLQQDTLVKLWGKANSGSKIIINVSWARKVFSTNSDSHDGISHLFPIDNKGRNISWYKNNNFESSKSYHGMAYLNAVKWCIKN